MRVCGNRQKVRSYRERHHRPPALSGWARAAPEPSPRPAPTVVGGRSHRGGASDRPDASRRSAGWRIGRLIRARRASSASAFRPQGQLGKGLPRRSKHFWVHATAGASEPPGRLSQPRDGSSALARPTRRWASRPRTRV